MQTKEIIIGRSGDFIVNDPYVGREHLKFIRSSDGSMYLEDLNSKGGTFVNGRKIKKKKVICSDQIMLGETYSLNLNKVLQTIPLSDAEFYDEFLKLNKVYEKYSTEKVKIQSESQGKMMIKRSLPMAIPGLIVVFFPILLGDDASPSVKTISTITGALLSAVAVVIGGIWGAKEMSKMPERMSELNDRFQLDYTCPHCKRHFGTYSWEYLRKQGKCSACGREFEI